MANLARNPVMEVNFVDPFVRKGYRFKGSARVVAKGTPEFATPLSRYRATLLPERYRAFVVLHVTKAAALISPAYDSGATEAGLRQQFHAYFESIQPKG